jgi:hypothetical protein
MGPENPINIGGDFGKPADTLIRKISNAVGGLFRPMQIKRIAQAEADAEVIRAKSQIEVTEIQRRAMYRWLEEEAQKQNNMESITAKALPQLSDDTRPQDIDDDWIANFLINAELYLMMKCKIFGHASYLERQIILVPFQGKQLT